eukprot:4366238-Amphidinium_carterae.2
MGSLCIEWQVERQFAKGSIRQFQILNQGPMSSFLGSGTSPMPCYQRTYSNPLPWDLSSAQFAAVVQFLGTGSASSKYTSSASRASCSGCLMGTIR